MITVDNNLQFYHNGRPIRVVYVYDRVKGRRGTAKICVNENKKTYYYQAAKIIAKHFKYGYDEDRDYIIYKDGNCHNIHPDNLVITDKRGYYSYMQRNSGHKADDMDKRIEKLNRIIKEATLTRDFFLTRDFSEINKHIEKVLLPILNDYCRRTIHLGISTTARIVPEAIGVLYDVIDNDMCLYNYERFLKKILLNYKKRGTFGFTANIPKPVHLNYDCLKEKYNVK